MSEIRTCEQYVIDRLLDLDSKTLAQEHVLQAQEDRINQLCAIIDDIKQLIEIHTYDKDEYRLELSVWSKYDHENFEKLVKHLNINLPEFEPDENSET